MTYPDGLNIVGTDALFAELPALAWLCRAMRMAPGAPTLIAGYGYSGKTVLAQCLTLAVASGLPLFGRYEVRTGRALHMDYEQGYRLTAKRYQRLALGQGLDKSELGGRLEAGILPSTGLDPALLEHMGTGRALVLIDSWRGAHPGVDENSSDVRRTLDAMGAASEKTGCVYVILHHMGKPQKDRSGGKFEIRGSSAFFDGCQTVYSMDGAEVGKPVLQIRKDRLGGDAMPPVALSIDDSHGGHGLSVSVEAEESVLTHEDIAEMSVELLSGSPDGLSASSVAKQIGIKQPRIVAVFQSLEAAGRIKKTGAGPSTRYVMV